MEKKFDYEQYNQIKQEIADKYTTVDKNSLINLFLYAAHYSPSFSVQMSKYLTKHHGFDANKSWNEETYLEFLRSIPATEIAAMLYFLID